MTSARKYVERLSRSLLWALSLLLVGSLTTYAQSQEDAYRVDEFKVSGATSLEVQTSGGSIQVYGSNENKVLVEMYVKRRGNYIEKGNADLDDYDISITQEGNTIKATAARRTKIKWNRNNYSVSFVVYTPNETRSRLKTSGGSLSAKNMTGTQELHTSGGSITAEGINGEMILNTSGGSISINDSEGAVNARTSGGSIVVASLSGDLDAHTSGGSIRLEDIEGRVKAKTSGGSIIAEIKAPSDEIDLRTSGGSISIKVPDGQGYDLDLDGTRVYVDLVNFTGEADKDEVNGTINGGGIMVRAKTSGGNVRFQYL